jgi:hypothetical protein
MQGAYQLSKAVTERERVCMCARASVSLWVRAMKVVVGACRAVLPGGALNFNTAAGMLRMKITSWQASESRSEKRRWQGK